MAASNTPEAVREFIGKRLVGLLRGELPLGDAGIASGTLTLIFEDGRGLTFSRSGSYWQETVRDVSLAVAHKIITLSGSSMR